MRKPLAKNQLRLVPGFFLTLALLCVCAVPEKLSARSFPDSVLGLRIGMSRDEVHRRLQRIGTLEREERGKQEIWTLAREPRFASMLVGFDAEFRVRYVTALAREGGQRMRYSDLGLIKDAYAENANGAYRRYIWEFKQGKRGAGYLLIAEGRDPEYLKSFSIKRKTNAEGPEQE